MSGSFAIVLEKLSCYFEELGLGKRFIYYFIMTNIWHYLKQKQKILKIEEMK